MAPASHTDFLNPPTLYRPPGYTHVVRVRGGGLLFISGQVAFDENGSLVGADDTRAQTEQVFRNLASALAAGGASFDSVVKLNLYVLDASALPVIREIRDRFVNLAHPPASTFVQVGRLARPELLIEVEAVASVD